MKRLALIGSLAKTTADVHWAIITNESAKSLGAGPPAPLTVHGFHARTYADLLNAGNWSQLCATLLEEGRGARSYIERRNPLPIVLSDLTSPTHLH